MDKISGSCKEYFYSQISRPAMEPTQSPIKWVQKAVSLAIKQPGRKADQLLSSRVEVLNQCSYAYPPPPTPPHMASLRAQGVVAFYLV